jgi:tetratricopeptide (TPR) repeat protein
MMNRLTLVAVLAGIIAVANPVYRIAEHQLAKSYASQRSALADMLDPRRLSLSLCGKDGRHHGLFFRSDFKLSVVPAALAAEAKMDDPPLWSDLGNHTHKITTSNPKAQAYFDQGLRLTYGFNHWEAIQAFREAQKIDPACAMCYWGEAYALGPNINAPQMDETAVEPAFSAVARAQALKANATPEERALIEALAVRYSPDPKADHAPLDKAYAAAMRKVYEAYPKDQDVATLYAESTMDASPWDYWERDFRTPKPEIAGGIAAIEDVLKANPDHPGAIHLYIHLVEASRTPERAEPYADRLVGSMPGAGHIVHMPSHIYFRVGRYLDSLKVNVKAVAADEAYFAQRKGSDIYRYGYYPHNVHFVLVSAQMAGDGATALQFADKLDKLIPADMVDLESWIAPIKAAPYFAYAEFGDPDKVLALPDPGKSAYLRVHWHYARGMALARRGDTAGVMAEADKIAALNTPEQVKTYRDSGVPADDIFTIAEMLLRARSLQAEKAYDRAIPLFARAAELQDGLQYQEPPYWYYSIQRSLGAAYLHAGQADKAADAFISSLVHHPNSAWSLYGLMKAQEAMNDPAKDATADLLEKAAVGKIDVSLDRL